MAEVAGASTRAGFGRGLPNRLQRAAAAPIPGFASSSSSISSGFGRPAGPLGGVVASAAERHVESDVNKGEFAAWRHLDPERKPDKAPYVPGLHPKPPVDDWEEDEPPAPYIPGMDPNPDFRRTSGHDVNNNNGNKNNNNNNDMLPSIPNAELVQDFRSGKKNPISALTEYCTAMHLTISFKEVAPPKRGAGIALKFANECSINGKAIRVMTGRTKKDAKTQAARATFAELLGLTEDDLEDDGDAGEGKQLIDSFGRKVALKSADSQWKSDSRHDATKRRPLREDEILPKLNLDDISVERRLRAKDHALHPVEILTQWSKQQHQPFTFETELLRDGLFRAVVKMDADVAGEGFGDTAKLAQREAARFVLDKVAPDFVADRDARLQRNEDVIADIFQAKHQELIFDIVKAANEAEQGMVDFDVDSLTEVPAVGFLLHRGPHIANAEVVSIALGTSVAHVLPTPDGRTLIDLHAFPLARRGFVKYLQSEVRAYLNGDVQSCIFEMTSNDILALKPEFRFSVFTTHAPTGDADVYARIDRVNDSNEILIGDEGGDIYHRPVRLSREHGHLRFKTEDGMTHTWDTPNPSRDEYPMSCSDKILRCNVLGYQGALLTHFIRPIYINRFVFGSKFDHGICVRALCCRINDDFVTDQPRGYQVRHPIVGRVSEYIVSSDDRLDHFPLAANWSLDVDPKADDRRKSVEILNPRSGKTFPWSPFRTLADESKTRIAPSRLCKAAFLYRFRELLREPKKSSMAGLQYAQVKERATAHNQLKKRFHQYMIDNEWGNWVKKPKEKLESFVS